MTDHFTNQPSPLDFPARWAAYHPQAPALSGAGETLSWAELDRRVERLATHLERSGMRPGDRVAVLAQNHPFFFELAFACVRAGLVLAPLNYRLAPRELGQLLELCEPSLLVVDAANLEAVERLTRPAGLRLVMQDELMRQRDALEPGTLQSPTRRGLGLDDLAILLFTSGTTGLPKAAMLAGRQLFWNAVNTCLAWSLTRQDSSIVYTPLFHTGAINVLAMPLFFTGGHVIVHAAFDADAILECVARQRVSVIFGVPTTLQMLAETQGFAAADLAPLRLVLCGGAPLPLALIHTWQERGMTVTQGFGMTEVGPNCFYLPGDQALSRAGSVGKPMPYCTAKVMVEEREAAENLVQGGGQGGHVAPLGRPDGIREAAVNEVGELWLSGPHVTLGYFRNPQATAASLVDGWFRTGDLARRDSDGFFHVAGRKKDMFISGGENVYPAEVEVVLAGHPDVAECAVVQMPDARWGEVGCAFVVPRDGGLQGDQLRSWLRERLAGYKVPKAFVAVESLPRNSSGKVMKDRLREEARGHAA
jgi:fatty-acyl-CoA synthase